MEFRKMLKITLYAEQKKRHRFIEQSFRLCGRRRGWDVSKYTFYISIKVYLTNDLSLFLISLYFISVQFSCSITANSLGHHGLQHIRLPSPTPGVAQTHVHSVCDATQLSHALSSPSPPASNLSQHQGLFQWVSSSSRMAKVLEFHLQYQSF